MGQNRAAKSRATQHGVKHSTATSCKAKHNNAKKSNTQQRNAKQSDAKQNNEATNNQTGQTLQYQSESRRDIRASWYVVDVVEFAAYACFSKVHPLFKATSSISGAFTMNIEFN